jgi:hypothetical protein
MTRENKAHDRRIRNEIQSNLNRHLIEKEREKERERQQQQNNNKK